MSRAKKRYAVCPETRELLYTSASAIKTFVECPRKWYMTYVLGLRSKSTPAQQWGKDLHYDIESYLGGELEYPTFQHAQIAASEDFLPKPADVYDVPVEEDSTDRKVVNESGFWSVEQPCKLLKLAGVPVKGFIDLAGIDSKRCEVIVIDHKSMRTTKYALDEHALKTDIQMLIYAAELILNAAGGDNKHWSAILTHIRYVREPAPGEAPIQQVPAIISSEAVFEQIRAIEGIVQHMKRVAKLPKLEDVTKNLSACGKYGGCYMLQVGCEGKNEAGLKLSTSANQLVENFDNPRQETSMNPLDKIRALRAKAKANVSQSVSPAPQIENPPEAPASAPPQVNYPPAHHVKPPDAAPNKHVQLMDQDSCVVLKNKGMTESRAQKWGVRTVGELVALIRTRAKLPGLGGTGRLKLIHNLKDVGALEKDYTEHSPAPPPEAVEATMFAGEETTPQPPPVVPSTPQHMVVEVEESPPAPIGTVTMAAAPMPTNSAQSFVFVDCKPAGVSVVDLGDELAQLHAAVEANNSEQSLQYGKRKQIMRQEFVRALPRLKAMGPYYFMSSNNWEPQLVGDTLIASLGIVVKRWG